MTLVKTAVEAEGVFQLCIKITNWISKINMEEKVETAPRRGGGFSARTTRERPPGAA